jgi:2-polyprenyl-3-methyl-5-hydroxy-6-metoxy-1,4-benzoquinol methylase
MSVPAARTDPCLKRYPLRRLRLPVANGTLDVVVPDAGAWLHTGGWSDRGSLFGQRCLDLGCGIGVPGIAAARLGAAVTFADREPDALAFAAWNARRQPAAEALVTTRVHDWHAGSVLGAFDLLLLADVTYRVVHHRPVLQQMAASLFGGGIAIHADPYRREVAGFLVQAKASFACCELALSTHWDGQRIPIRVCVFAEQQVTLDRWAATAKLNMPRKLADDQGECPATLRPLA